jgi:hypothetical protein
MSLLLHRDFNAKPEYEEQETTTATGTHSLHDDSSEKGLRPINYA